MAKSKSQKKRLNPPRFPYEIIWEEIGNEWVTIEDLASNADEYRFFAEHAQTLDLDVPSPGKRDFRFLIDAVEIDPSDADRLTEEAQLIAGWYLAPKRRKAIQNDLNSARQKLKGISRSARDLDRLLGEISAHVQEVMNYVRVVEPEALDRTSRFEHLKLGRTLHDLALVADRIIEDAGPQRTGRQDEYVRDTTIRLAIEAARRAGLDDLRISRGTRDKPGPHLNGQAGQFLKGFFTLTAPNIHEASLTPAAERVRRKMKTS